MCEANEKKNQPLVATKLLDKRVILAFGNLDEMKAGEIIAALLYMEMEDPEGEITLYVNSCGGNETEIFGIYDVMQKLSCPIRTVCVGKAHGLSALLVAGGGAGKRFAYANAEMMLMQVGRDRTFGQASDIELETNHLLDAKKRFSQVLAKHCKKDAAAVEADMERKFWLYAEKALEYGLIDRVI